MSDDRQLGRVVTRSVRAAVNRSATETAAGLAGDHRSCQPRAESGLLLRAMRRVHGVPIAGPAS
jgi:hypothetical protein